jgi:hypothetical protein
METTSSSARFAIVRGALIYTPLFVASGGGFIVVLVLLMGGGEPGLLVTLVIAGLAALLTGYQSIQSLRDLAAQPRTSRGSIRRKWSRSDFLIARSHYIYVEKTVFKVDPITFVELEEGDAVSVLHYPHTNTVLSVGTEESEPAASTPPTG